MADLTLQKTYGALRRHEISPTYYLTGAADVLKDELVAAITDAALDPADRDFNYDVRSAGDLNGETLHALIETPPMLAERRVVVVRGIDQWRKNAKVWEVLHRYLENPSPTTVLILTQSGDQKPSTALTARTTHVAMGELKPAQIRRWLIRRAERVSLRLEADAADHLIAAVGGELSYLASEVEKLAAAVPDDRPVSAADIATFVGVRRGETMHDWVDTVLARDAGRAVSVLDVVLARAGVTGVQMLMSLGTALVGTRLARAMLDDGTPPTQVERAVYRGIQAARLPRLRRWGLEASNWTKAAGHWTARELDSALAAAYDADRQLKSTTISDDGGIVKNLLLRLAAREAA